MLAAMALVLLLCLTLLGSLPALFENARLWQLKEWRWHRLHAHISENGWFRPLFGLPRTGLALIALPLISLYGQVYPMTEVALLLFAGTIAVPVLRRKQVGPVWTQKAIVTVGIALLLTASAAWLVLSTAPWLVARHILIGIAFFQPLFLGGSWFLLQPLDRMLKQRRFARARTLRVSLPDLNVIAITGSVGKTTTKELLQHLLRERNAVATPAFVNSELGVTDWFIKTCSKTSPPAIAVVEVGAYRAGEIALVCSIIQPTMSVVTYIGKQHLALFGSEEKLLEAKAEIVSALKPDGHLFLNADNERSASLSARSPCPVTTVGTVHGNRRAQDLEETRDGLRFTLDTVRFDVPLHGTHNISNILLAVAVAEKLGLPLTECAERLRKFSPPRQTFTVRQERGCTVLDDTHNSSPHSFQAAIEWARTQPNDHKVLLCSGLIELGEEHDRVHIELGQLCTPVFERIICTSGRSGRAIAEGYDRPVETPHPKLVPIVPGSLLVCEGRVPVTLIHQLLPSL